MGQMTDSEKVRALALLEGGMRQKDVATRLQYSVKTDLMFSQKFSPLSSLLEGGAATKKASKKWESGTGVRKKLKILAWVPLVIVFFLH